MSATQTSGEVGQVHVLMTQRRRQARVIFQTSLTPTQKEAER